MELMGMCSKASSPWASPLHMVHKPDGSWRPCGDYRRFNLITEPDYYARVFSKLDLLKGYFQVPVHSADVSKTAIITPFGSYVFHYSTFGFRNSGATFQRMTDSIFGDLSNVLVYIDDLLIFSNSIAPIRLHENNLRGTLTRLQRNGLIVRQDKCVFAASTVESLGHQVSANGLRPLQSKVSVIQNYPRPTMVW